MIHSSIEWSLKKKIKKEISKFEIGKNQSQKGVSENLVQELTLKKVVIPALNEPQ